MTRTRTLLAVLTALVLVLTAAPLAGADEGEDSEEDGGLGRGALAKIELLAAEFATDTRDAETVGSDLGALLEAGVGFGDAFRIQFFISATDAIDDLDAFLAAAWDEETGEYDFSWGELKKGLDDEEALAALPKNLGQLVSSVKRGHGRPDHAASLDDDGERGKRDRGKGDREKGKRGDGGDRDEGSDD